MILEMLCVGPLQANCYIVGCPETHKGLIIDPGGEPERILEAVERLGLQIEYILNTHGHVDHIAANAAVQEATGARLLVHEDDRGAVESPHPFWRAMVGGVEPSEPDGAIDEGDLLEIGTLTVRVLHTPGHTRGCVCLLLDDHLFTGDTLFAGGVGRTDLPGGDASALQQSLRRLRDELPPQTQILPGHGPASSMREERRTNPFLQAL